MVGNNNVFGGIQRRVNDKLPQGYILARRIASPRSQLGEYISADFLHCRSVFGIQTGG